jgi:RNA polymerase sigma-70 factor (ECF subfamily)
MDESERQDQVRAQLERLDRGDELASSELLALVYDELRRLANKMLLRQPPGHTLQATALVHEAWLKLAAAAPDGAEWEGRSHFLGVASKAMRQVLVNHARDARAQKRGGDEAHRVTLDECLGLVEGDAGDVVALDDALRKLAELDPRRARIVELRVFGGASIDEAAGALGVGVTTIKEDWRVARAWLRRELSG